MGARARPANQHGAKRGGRERLHQEIVHPGGEAGVAIILEGVGGQRHDGGRDAKLAQLPGGLLAVRGPACACPLGSGRRTPTFTAVIASSPRAAWSTEQPSRVSSARARSVDRVCPQPAGSASRRRPPRRPFVFIAVSLGLGLAGRDQHALGQRRTAQRRSGSPRSPRAGSQRCGRVRRAPAGRWSDGLPDGAA